MLTDQHKEEILSRVIDKMEIVGFYFYRVWDEELKNAVANWFNFEAIIFHAEG